MRRAVFLDRDGVLIEDVHLLTRPEEIRVLPRVGAALQRLRKADFLLIVVSNQTVVSRGLATEEQVAAINSRICELLGTPLDAIYICPHHPNATLAQYRQACECRKPRAGLFFRAAQEHGISLRHSFAVGDRITDIAAGARAGCRTVLVQTGRHTAPPIETVDPLDSGLRPDCTCDSMYEAAEWILCHA